jgi:hypothetical protein
VIGRGELGIHREQLRIACDRWEGTARPVAERLAAGDPAVSVAGTCEWRVLGDAEGPRFDAWLIAGDSGTCFVAGTTRAAAVRVQGAVRSDPADAALEAALDQASEA